MKQALLNEKIKEIDNCIIKKEKATALSLIDEVLEYMPGWKIGDKIQQSGAIYWKKLLAEAGCKDNKELLESGYVLKGNPAFENAKKYANDNERPIYESVEKAKDLIVESLMTELAKKELEAKRQTGVKEKLLEYKQKMSDLNKLAQNNINRLEEKEKEIHEQLIDCEIVSGEYKYALENLHSEAQKVSNNHKPKIYKEEKNAWETQLELIETESSLELNKLEQLKFSHQKFLEYSNLVKEHEDICEEINRNKADLDRLNSEAEQLVNYIKNIVGYYAKARDVINNGSYAIDTKILSQEHFKEIVEQAISKTKLGDN